MQFRAHLLAMAAGASLISVAVAGGSAAAGPALDDDKSQQAAQQQLAAPELQAPPETPVEYGVGVRLRSVYVPKSILELFLDRAAGGAHNYGVGVDLTRRRGNLELQLGFEYEKLTVGEGVWINKGDNVAQGDEADYVLSPDHSGNHLGWITAEFTFINHTPINKYVSFRYGGGLGLGVILGELDHYNIICAPGSTNDNPSPGCVPDRFGGTGTYHEGTQTQVAYNLPPVFPVVNAIIGFQFKPTDKWTINVEGGIRTLPFFGIESSYFF
ncbi:MAG TPA: hypothetical protein VGM88_01410 [Kofleriaceae bacterium]|jgi:hypothetical protein